MQAQEGETQQAQAQRATSTTSTTSTSTNMQSKETPISNYPTLTYGLQETHTTILPWTGWCSAARLGWTEPATLSIKCNRPFNLIGRTTSTDPTFTSGIPQSTGIVYGQLFEEDHTSAYPPAQVIDETKVRANWMRTWFELYEYYTVLKCHLNLTANQQVKEEEQTTKTSGS